MRSTGISMERKWGVVHFAAGLAAVAAASAPAATLNVPADYPTIQAAINAAANGDEVVVAPGTYSGAGNSFIKTLGKKITLRSAEGAATCFLEATTFEFSSSETPQTVIEGFTIRNAKDGTLGGSVSIFGASPTIRSCVFTGCKKNGNNGGAIRMLIPTSAPVIDRCVFADNVCGVMGGAISVDNAKPTITNCLFVANVSAAGYGGGIYLAPGSEAKIEHCMFVGNSVSGIYSEAGTTDPSSTVVNCLFTGNSPNNFSAGGGVHSTQKAMSIVNCTFTGNVGSAVGKRATITNSILADSVSLTGEVVRNQVLGALADIDITYSDVENGWTGGGGNNISDDPQFPQLGSGTWTIAPTYDATTNRTIYTDANASFEPGALAGTVMNPDTAQQRRQYIVENTPTTVSVYGNFTPEPLSSPNLLVDAGDAYEIFDVRPVAGSPVIDAGNNSALPPTLLLDLDGQPRLVDDPDVIDTGAGRTPIVDMGAFERQVTPSADLNGDGAVNPVDLGLLLGAWGTGNASADLDADGTVGPSDLAILLGAWTA
jgi:hypothetical protein